MATRGMTEFRADGVDYTVNDPNIAKEFDATEANAKGDYVNYQGDLYRFTAAHTANTAWGNRSKTKVKLGEEIKDLKTEVQDLDNGKVPNTRKVNGHALSDDVTVTKGDVGLGNVDNTSDANKPVSTAAQAALDLKIDKANIENDLTATTAGYVLDARQGKVLGSAVNNRAGDKYALSNVLDQYGYVLPVYSREAWDFSSNTKVAVNNVVMASVNEYENGGNITITIPSGYNFRVTFLAGTTIKSASEWFSASRGVGNSLGADNFTVEFKKSNSSDISDMWQFVSKIGIQLDYKIIRFAEQSAIYPYEGAMRTVLKDGGFFPLDYSYGAWDFVNQQLVSVNNVIHVESSYTLGTKIYIYGVDPVGYRYRVSFWNGTSLIGNTDWRNDASFTIQNTVTGVDTVSFEIKKADSSQITDFVSAIGSFSFRLDDVSFQSLKTKIESFAADDITTVGFFDKWATVGDSFSVGRWYINNGGTYTPVKTSRLAWGSIIAREVGNTFLSLGIGGINTRTFLSADPSTGGGMALAESSPVQDLYFLCLGINDTSLGASYIGSASDIPSTYDAQHPDTFYGNYGEIIKRLQHHAEENNTTCLFIISKLVAWNDATVKDAFNAAIAGIADAFSIPCINPEDDYFFTSAFYLNYRGHNNGHPTGMTYGGMAAAYKRLISKCIEQNPNYFKYYNGVADGGA